MMDILLRICDVENHMIRVSDQSNAVDVYIPDDSNEKYLSGLYAKGKFKYNQTSSIYILSYISTKDTKIIDSQIVDHCSYLDESYFSLDKDGYYVIDHLVLPTKEWFDNEMLKKRNVFRNDSDFHIYITDGEKIYYYNGTNLLETSIELLQQINTEGTSISKITKNIFYIRYLRECFISFCKGILDKTTFKCLEKNTGLKDIIWKRDFIWMTINAINFYVEDNKLYEALRILELVNYCGGFCKSESEINKSIAGCGCNKN